MRRLWDIKLGVAMRERILLDADRLRRFAQLRLSTFGRDYVAREARLRHLHNIRQRYEFSDRLGMHQQRPLHRLECVGWIWRIGQDRLLSGIRKAFAGTCRRSGIGLGNTLR